MIESIISILVISLECFLVGSVLYHLYKYAVYKKDTIYESTNTSVISSIIFGIVVITIYTEFFSVFYPIGFFCHLSLDAICIIVAAFFKRDLKLYINNSVGRVKEILFSWEGFFYLCCLLIVAFYTSRGQFHADTRIYHAQNIRIYEEYGLIKGMANIQQHFGYNSASLAFSSFFSYGFLLSKPWHTTTGFFMFIMGTNAFHKLKDFKTHEYHWADMCQVGVLLYVLTNISYSMSPATDYPTMLMAMFVFCEWTRVSEKSVKDKDTKYVNEYIDIALLSIFVSTMKLSAATICILVILPLTILIKNRDLKKICICILLGLVIVAPYLIRNILISGWLVYPFEGIDLFNVEWKVPIEKVAYDSNQIKVWGKCLYDVNLKDTPFMEWVRIWWNRQETYQQTLIIANLFGTILIMINSIRKIRLSILKKVKISYPLLLMYLSLFLSAITWFLMAPFVRYGLCFLLIIPMLALGEYLNHKHKGLDAIVSGVLVACIFLSFGGYIGNYSRDDRLFIQKYLKEPYYIFQQDYTHCEPKSIDMKGNTVYYYESTEDENDYYHCPSSYYDGMLMDSELLGDKIIDGFKNID